LNSQYVTFSYHPIGSQDSEISPRILKNLYTFILSIFEKREILLSATCANYSDINTKESAIQNLVKKMTDYGFHDTPYIVYM